MPKMKSKSGAKKRFRKTGSGKVRYNHSNARHLLTSKSTKRKRKLREAGILDKSDAQLITRMLPYL